MLVLRRVIAYGFAAAFLSLKNTVSETKIAPENGWLKVGRRSFPFAVAFW